MFCLRFIIVLALVSSSVSLKAEPYQTGSKETSLVKKSQARKQQTGWFYGAFTSINSSYYAGVGADTVALPIIGYIGTRFSFLGPRASYIIHQSAELEALALITYKSVGYKPNDSKHLDGMTRRQNSLFGGLSTSIKKDRLSYTLSYLHDLQNHSGGQDFTLAMSYRYNYGPFFLTPKISLNYLDSAYSNYYFGVRDHESNSDRQAYTPNTSINPSVSLNFATPIFLKGFTRASVTHSWLDSSLYNSPIVNNKNHWKVNLSFTRFF